LNVPKYFDSLTLELRALKNRVRNFIDDRHWQTDGEWKESVLRTFLRKHLPTNVEVGRGFILASDGVSTQIDVLIHDSAKPVLFRDGDLVFVTPDAVLGVIEVKSKVNNTSFRESLEKLSRNSELARRHSPGRKFFGFYAFEDSDIRVGTALQTLHQVVGGDWNRVVHCVALGESKFLRFWNIDPATGNRLLDKWYAYTLPNRAPGYFLHNVVEEICPESVVANQELWFPDEGKARYKVG